MLITFLEKDQATKQSILKMGKTRKDQPKYYLTNDLSLLLKPCQLFARNFRFYFTNFKARNHTIFHR